MKRTLLFLVLHIAFLTSAFGQTLSDSITIKKVSRKYELYQNENKITVKQLTKVLEYNQEALRQLKSAKTSFVFEAITGFGGFGMLGWETGKALSGKNPNWIVIGAGAGLVVTSISLGHKKIRQLKNAVKTYNDGLKKPVLNENEIKISMSGNRVGLIMTF